MDDLDALRLEHATTMLAKGKHSLSSDVDAGYYHIWSARMLIIATKLKDSGELPSADISALLADTIDCVTNRGANLHLEKQNELMILALAIAENDSAEQIALIDCCANDSHRFDITLNGLLRSFFVPTAQRDVSYRPSKSEQLLFDDIHAVSENRTTDLSNTDRYWNATKSKRYSYTVFAHHNLFRLALEQLKRI